MGKSKSRAQQFAGLTEPVPKDFDPEEDIPENNSNGSGSEDSGDDLAGTEHYAQFGKSKLRKTEEVALGPQYAGSRISRDQLLDDESDSKAEPSDSEEEYSKFADPDDSEIEVDDEDGDIDSDAAFGESDSEKFKEFTFRGSGKPVELNGHKKRATAADFMSTSEDEGVALDEVHSGEDETDEDVLDTARQHSDDSENEVFSTARQSPEKGGFESKDLEDEESFEGGDEDDDMDSMPIEDARSSNGSESEDEDDDDEKERKADLKKFGDKGQNTLVATISQAAKADADKGNAVKQQRKAFDSLLSVRMVLQKALVATNSMTVNEDKDTEDAPNQPYGAAEEAAIKLWNTLDGLRHDLSKSKAGGQAGQKRKRGVDISTPSPTIWERMQNSEISEIDTRQTTLEKWSAKVRGPTSVAIEGKVKRKQASVQSITSVIQEQLSNSDHLIRKTKIPRSCAPVQRDLKISEDPNIYDDGHFYQLLLKELVDQRRVESLTAPAAGAGNGGALQWTAVKEAKTKKNVDTKASKGRKMRYTVHEKLQNFMAPEDRANWEPDAIDRFFGTLLGQKMTLREEEMDVDGDEEVPLEEEGLKLFRSS
ncbi:Protein bfr2 [Lachnellula hyalina]|uniref:Protein BFR2 n=1 Tax=Lachnellula hyalina TaxID=1316788 RepID=A0A8H8RCN9_9HELO|nr:Protein bfr2 [Lachnellula hyalina]TVY30937.1 Protein bfr2 [Lachnellula hyalina]